LKIIFLFSQLSNDELQLILGGLLACIINVVIGVKAGKFWGVRRTFAQISANLPKKSKKRLYFTGRIFSSQGTSTTIFPFLPKFHPSLPKFLPCSQTTELKNRTSKNNIKKN